MISKLKRSKSAASELQPTSPLRGMPELKQKRANQRRSLIASRMLDLLPQTLLTGPSRTDCGKDDVNFVENPPDLLKNTRNVGHHDACLPDLQKVAQKNDVGHSGERKNISSPMSGKFVSSEHKEANSRDSKEEKKTTDNNRPRNKKSSCRPKKAKKDKNRGRGLHSVKKKRKADRERNLSASMRALTPMERESILVLEEAWRSHEDSSLSCTDDDDEVFGAPHNGQIDDNCSSSTESPDGSIIDLVGNLSDVNSSSLSPTSLQCSPPSFTVTSQNRSSEEKTCDERRWQRNWNHRVYAEIKETKVEPVMQKVTSHNEEIYEEIGGGTCNGGFTYLQDTSGEKSDSKIVDPTTSKADNTVATEAIYSVVQKPKKELNPEKTSTEVSKNHDKVMSDLAIMNAQKRGDQITSEKFGKFPNNATEHQIHSNKDRIISLPSLYHDSPTYVYTPIASCGIDRSYKPPATINIDQSLENKYHRFIIVPKKNCPSLAPESHAKSDRRSKSSNEINPSDETGDLNGNVLHDGCHLDFDENGDFVTSSMMSLTLNNRNGVPGGKQHFTSHTAIPRHTALLSSPHSDNKRFVVTPASKHAGAWK